MTSIAVLREQSDTDSEPRFTAVTNTGTLQSVGKTVGEAIDALTVERVMDDHAIWNSSRSSSTWRCRWFTVPGSCRP